MSPAIGENTRRALLLATAALATAGTVRAVEPPPAGGGVLRITADPPRLVLGSEDGAALRVTAPAEVDEISLTASAGRIEGVRKAAAGGFTARFRAPPDRVPRVAIISASARTAKGLEDGWLAIPLSGEGDARVRGTPGSGVTLRIGDRTFGPRKAGPDGVAVIPVIVPPGVREAHQGFRPMDLRIPETPLLHAIQDRTTIRADREETIHVVAYVVAPHGAARRGDPPWFEPSRGTVTVTEREAGAFPAVWTLPPGPAGEARLSIRLPSAAASRTVLKVEAAAGPPAVVAVSFDRDALVAGGEAAVVTARAMDAGGNVVPAELELGARGAVLRDVRARRPGEVVARLEAGSTLQADEAIVTATADEIGVSGARALPLRPGDPAEARFQPREPVVRSDGSREAVLRISVEDRFGNPVSAAPVVTAARGRVVEVTSRKRGEYAVRYVGPHVDRVTPDEVVARVGTVRAAASPLLAPPGPALLVSARAGVARDARGRFAGPTAGVAAERPADVAFALRHGVELAWRIEAEGLRDRDAALGALLAGVGARRAVGRAQLGIDASAGVVLARGAQSVGGRLAFSLAIPRRWGAPFLEASVLGAGTGAPGPFAALGLSAGMRFGLENPHGHDPHRR